MHSQCLHPHVPQDFQLASAAAQLDPLLAYPLCFPKDIQDKYACFVGSAALHVPFQPVPPSHTFTYLNGRDMVLEKGELGD